MEQPESPYPCWAVTRREFFGALVAAYGGFATIPQLLNAAGLPNAASLPAESASPSVESSPLTYPGKGVTLHGYLSKPIGGGAHPAVIVLHGNSGLNEHIRQVGMRLSSEGYVTLSVDFLSRLGGTESFGDFSEATKATARIKEDQVYDDLDAAFEFLAANASVKKDRIALLGLSWGADRVFQYLAVDDKPKAAIVFDSAAPSEVLIQHVACPVLGLYGGLNSSVASDVAAIEARTKRSGKAFAAKVYPGVAEGFLDATDKARYNEVASNDAWGRVLQFLKTNLK